MNSFLSRLGHQNFRLGQREVIENILANQDTIAVMPTGSGKSICYQIPALMLGGVCLVVSPLIALMQDQVRGLREKGVSADCLHSGMTSNEKFKVMEAVKSSCSFILFVSPERFVQDAFHHFLFELRLCLIVIDEAHCVVEWGSEFRPDYQRLHLLKDRLSLPVLAMTASATPLMRKEISRHLHLENPKVVCSGFFRPNLICRVITCDEFEEKLEVICREIQSVKSGRILIYCATRLQCEAVAGFLENNEIIASYYHAGLTAPKRSQIQHLMDQGQIRILCCTCAFGMGINYPDVRLVIHFEITTSLEDLYQEMGRAGRDGEAANTLVLFAEKDLRSKYMQLASREQDLREAKRKLKAIQSLESFLRLKSCRQRFISEYFGDFDSLKKHKNCGACDFCLASELSPRTSKILDSALRNRLRKLR